MMMMATRYCKGHLGDSKVSFNLARCSSHPVHDSEPSPSDNRDSKAVVRPRIAVSTDVTSSEADVRVLQESDLCALDSTLRPLHRRILRE